MGRLKSKIKSQIAEFKDHLARMKSIEVRYIKQSSRCDIYRWCHRKARSRIIEEDSKQLDILDERLRERYGKAA